MGKHSAPTRFPREYGRIITSLYGDEPTMHDLRVILADYDRAIQMLPAGGSVTDKAARLITTPANASGYRRLGWILNLDEVT